MPRIKFTPPKNSPLIPLQATKKDAETSKNVQMVLLTGFLSRCDLDLKRLAELALSDGTATQGSLASPHVTLRKQAQTRLGPAQQRELILNYQAGNLMKDLAAKYRVHPVTVRHILRRHGVIE